MKILDFLCFFCLFSLPILANAQFMDNFNDGNFTNNPGWEGDLDDFIVNSDLQLQLSAADAGTSLIYVNSTIPDDTVWEMFFKANFAPSNNNNLRVYLQSDDMTFNGNGYFFEFGESGTDDAIKLFRMDDGASTLLGTGQLGAVGSAPADGRIKIMRSADGEWLVNVDYSGRNDLLYDFDFTDNTYPGSSGNYFGIQCKYSSTNVEGFFFDDIKIDLLPPDVTPPAIANVEVISAFELDVIFNEPIEEASAALLSNYTVTNGIGNPISATLDDANPTLVHLSFANEFTDKQNNMLTVNGLQDIVGNLITEQNTSFTFFILEFPQPFEIVINEIMPIPNPPVGLPNVEFVEIFNNTNKTFELSGTTIESGGTPQVFGNYSFESGTYLILCDDSNVDALAPFGNVFAFTSFPSLTDDGDEFILKNEDGVTLDAISYTKAWYRDGNKDDGGWSIELINPNSNCEFESNWRASEDIAGGTPGRANSVLNPNQSSPQAQLKNLSINDNEQLILTFNIAIDDTFPIDLSNYTISPNLGITSVIPEGDLGNQVKLTFDSPLETGVIYVITTNNLTDCIGNAAQSNSLEFGKPEVAEAGDILINEILFNPESFGEDYVELYNNSNKIIDMSSLIIGNFMPGDSSSNAITTNRLLLPDSYVVLTPNPSVILEGFRVETPEALRNSLLPSFDDNAGNVTLYRTDSGNSTIIDQFDYEDDFHSAFLDNKDGVSLERIDFNAPTQQESNWTSAAASAGFGTPTFLNSQFINLNSSSEDLLSFQKKAFSPDGDGFEDLLFLQYNTGSSGFTANIRIFDAEGRMVKHLLKNEIIPIQGTLRWDGLTDEGTKAGIGIYVLFAEFISESGDVQAAKETFVLATRL